MLEPKHLLTGQMGPTGGRGRSRGKRDVKINRDAPKIVWYRRGERRGPGGMAISRWAVMDDDVPAQLRTPARAGDMEAYLHNEWTLVIFAEYLAMRRAPRTGAQIAVDTVRGS